MSNSGGFALTRTHGSDRFYNPPPVRRHQQLLLQQQRQLRRAVKSENRVESGESETRTDSDESTLSRPNSACSSSPPRQADLTNLDRVMESVTPFVPAQFFSEVVYSFMGLFVCREIIRKWTKMLLCDSKLTSFLLLGLFGCGENWEKRDK